MWKFLKGNKSKDAPEEQAGQDTGPEAPAQRSDEKKDVFDRISADIGENDVVLFMKGSPVFPQCGFSATAVEILSRLGTEFKGVDVLSDESIRQGIKDYSDWPTIPQLYVKGEFVGGCDIMIEMYQSGELLDHLKEAGVKTEPQEQPAQ